MPLFHSLRCPVCEAPLAAVDESDKVYKCPSNHSFDVAREGYLNLLLAHKKKTADPGDNADMLQSRRRFLEAGYYRFMPQAILEQAGDLLGERLGEQAEALDVGCGEGYYTGLMQADAPYLRWSGLDISRPGVRMAAKKYRGIPFVVGSSFELPFETASQMLAVQIFAPSSASEIRRVLQPGGVFVAVNPGPEHLLGLKEKLYQQPKKHAPARLQQEGLELVEERVLRRELSIEEPQHVQDLFKMTPFYWTVGETRRAELAGVRRLQTAVEFHVAFYRRVSRFDPQNLWGGGK